jgi:carbon-monoxide dehydrogenase medium subunit
VRVFFTGVLTRGSLPGVGFGCIARREASLEIEHASLYCTDLSYNLCHYRLKGTVMKPPRFRYCVAETVEEAIAALDEYGDDAKVLAGGQSLIPLMNLRLARPGVLVDINRVATLSGVSVNGSLALGATTRQVEVERSDVVAAAAPLLCEALHHVGHPAIRSRGTIGGSAAHADPASEIPAVLLALDATFTAQGPSGTRTIEAEDFFVTTFTTALAETELLTSVSVPSSSFDRSTFVEIARRHGDFALVGVAAAAAISEDGRVTSARLALSNVADRPIRAYEAEQFLEGRALDDAATVVEAAEIATSDLRPPSDLHASRQDRHDLSRALVRRALNELATEGGR